MNPRVVQALIVVSASSLGCSKGPGTVGEGDGGSPTVSSSAGLRPPAGSSSAGLRPPTVLAGDRVVIESAMATFVEGVVASVSRDRARVQLGGGGEVSERALGDLYVPSN